MSAPCYELLQWHDATTSNPPDSDLTVAVWSPEHALLTAWWDAERGAWIDCATGSDIGDVTHWADPEGPMQIRCLAGADVPVDQVRGALAEALDLLRGWIATKCPKRFRAEHTAAVQALADAGGLG